MAALRVQSHGKRRDFEYGRHDAFRQLVADLYQVVVFGYWARDFVSRESVAVVGMPGTAERDSGAMLHK